VSDTILLLLKKRPPSNAVFAGWNSAAPASLNDSVFSLHFPSANYMRFSEGGIQSYCTAGPAFGGAAAVTGGIGVICLGSWTAEPFYQVKWSHGIIQAGSSGAPLFNMNNQVIGVISAQDVTYSACLAPAYVGRFDKAFQAGLWKVISVGLGITPVTTMNSTDALSTVYRFYNAKTGGHFYTASEVERLYVMVFVPDFAYEGAVFKAYSAPVPSTIPVYRLYNFLTGVHLFTVDIGLRDDLVKYVPLYSYEEISWYVQYLSGNGANPVYDFYDNENGEHFYTISSLESDFVKAYLPNYVYKGIAFYAWPLSN